MQTIAVGNEPAMVAVNPTTNKAYVSLHGEGRTAMIDGAGTLKLIDIYDCAGSYGIAVDTVRNLVYVATIETFRIVAIDGNTDTYLGWAEIRREQDGWAGMPAPLRMIAVNPSIGSSGHLFVTTTSEDGGWNMLLTLAKGWPEGYARAYALDLNEAREGIAFAPGTLRLFASSRTDNLVAVYLDGEPVCATNFLASEQAEGYLVKVCVAGPDGTCQQILYR
jgi:hypothetical protein